MQSVKKMPAEAIGASANKFVVNAMAVTCGAAVLVLICMATSGLDMSVGFF
jgi:hypothetical protein